MYGLKRLLQAGEDQDARVFTTYNTTSEVIDDVSLQLLMLPTW